MSDKLRQVNWTYLVVKTVVLAFMTGAAGISFGHIVHVSHELGLTWEALTVPFFVDGLAILGLVGRTDKFDASTKRAGMVLVTTAGTLSLVCNVYAGANLGQRLYGALVVAGFALAEWYAGRLKAAPALRSGRKLEPTVAAARARKARATREANRLAAMTPGQRAADTRKRRAVRPVSPGAVPLELLNAGMVNLTSDGASRP